MAVSVQSHRLLFCITAVSAVAVIPSSAAAQLSGTYRSAPGTVAIYTYHHGEYFSVPLPADVTVRFSPNNSSTLTAVIHQPIIGDVMGNHNYPIVHEFPMVVTGTSHDGHTFSGDLLDTQYLFEWTFEPAAGGELVWSGDVGWAGGRVEHSRIDAARMIPLPPGDYNENGTVDAADYIVWRKSLGQSGSGLPANGNGDAQVDADDHVIWRENFSQSSSASALSGGAIPEPATWLLLSIAAVAWHSCQRR